MNTRLLKEEGASIIAFHKEEYAFFVGTFIKFTNGCTTLNNWNDLLKSNKSSHFGYEWAIKLFNRPVCSVNRWILSIMDFWHNVSGLHRVDVFFSDGAQFAKRKHMCLSSTILMVKSQHG